jgi:hypothetical protein
MYINRWWNITHVCNEKQNSRIFLILPNQTDRARHTCTSAGGNITHACNEKQNSRVFFIFTKPNQTESKHHPYTSAGGGISHMPAMKSKIRGFFSCFYQTKPNLEGASFILSRH